MSVQMKLTAGLGRIDDYPAFAGAGADEVFLGFIPSSWQLAYGPLSPMNRREASLYQTQAGTEGEMELLRGMIDQWGVPAAITLNSRRYIPEQYPVLAEFMHRCAEHGFCDFIIADPVLLLWLKEREPDERLHLRVSGEFGELNRFIQRELKSMGASRIIFPRHTPPEDMALLTSQPDALQEYEAFLLNERCQFCGAWCGSLHTDAMPPLCRMPYSFVPVHALSGSFCCPISMGNLPPSGSCGPKANEKAEKPRLGAGGCGLCALWRLREAGVTHLKIVGRGAYGSDMVRDIRAARTALNLLYASDSEEAYLSAMKACLFPSGCGGDCYYP